MIPRKPSKPVSDRWTDLEPREKRKAKPRRPMRKQGVSQRAKERRQWDQELKAWFATLNIHACEVQNLDYCIGNWLCALAHSRKRRKIENKEQYFEVVLACQKCHEWLDNVLSHEDMERIVKEIIEKREAKP